MGLKASLALLVPLAVGSVLAAIFLGAERIYPGEALQALLYPGAYPQQGLIVREIRLPRTVLSFLVGAALALSGAVMQGVFHNPLACPYVLGLAGGAAAGAAGVIVTGIRDIIPVPLGAFLGALMAVVAVYRLGKGGRSGLELVLAGVAVGSLFTALTSFMLFLAAGDRRLAEIVFWTMGSFGRADWPRAGLLAPAVAAGLLSLWVLGRRINALALGDEGARYLGVDPVQLRRLLLFWATLLTAASVSVAGIVGFVGLVAPHLVRLVLGPDQRVLLPVAALVGGILLVWAEALARVVLAPAELPVGIITACIGGPFFLWLLRRRLK